METRPKLFQVGEVWISPKGTIFKVVRAYNPSQVVLGRGFDGSGRKVLRRCDRVDGWAIHPNPPDPPKA